MPKLLTFILITLSSWFAKGQTYDYSIGRQTEKVDSVYELLWQYEELGYKSVGTPGLRKTKDWITEKYESYGYQVEYDTFDYQHKKLENIIVEKPGIDSNRWIIVCAHYDSYTNSKGVNDNGTGVIACLQIARIMRNIETQVGIRIINFTAEELGLVGSRHYVENYLDPKDSIELVLNLDQLGGTAGADNSKIYCERDEHKTPSSNNYPSWRKTDTLANLIEIYSFLTPVISAAYASDYMPFQAFGYIITGLYQHSDYPFYHQSGDLLANMDTDATHQVVQGALAAVMHFSRHMLPVSIEEFVHSDMIPYPNPSEGIIHVSTERESRISVLDQYGKVVAEPVLQGTSLDLTELPTGLYYVEFRSENEEIIRTKVIIAR